VIFRPASQAALKTVVATCETPPPTPSSYFPPTITGAERKPRASVRGPTCSLKENVAPGAIRVPSRWAVASFRFVIRFSVPV
jgi:hypothetical protein